MKLFSALFCLFICASVQASQGFYRESIIDPANALSVLDPAKRPEIERLAQNLRFFGQLGARPANNVYVHYQAIQNLLVYPQSPVTALSWMLFPVSYLPTINPNNIRESDPLGTMTPKQLGQLIAVIAKKNVQLQELYQIFVDPKKVTGFTANHKEDDLKKFYRYALINGVSKYVHRNMTPMDEGLNLTAEQQTEYEKHPHLLVTAAFKNSSSHLLEIPGTEILHKQNDLCELNETWFTQDALETGLEELPMPVEGRKIYKKFSKSECKKFRTMATVDMLWKSALSAPEQTLQLLTHYAWRKFGDQIDKVLLASGAIEEAQRPDLVRILANPFTKADYKEIVDGVKKAGEFEGIDGFIDSLTEGKRNLLLYGGARYAQIRLQEYGNVRVERLEFANCAEMSLFNLSYLAQLEEQEMGLEHNVEKLPEGSPIRLFWQKNTEENSETTETRNKWTQIICGLEGVVYCKGGEQHSPWTKDNVKAHWAELNPGILNQMRTLLHLLGKPAEAAALTYAGSTEATIEAAALHLSHLLSGEPTDDELSFKIAPSEIKNIPGKKDWYGNFEVTRNGEKLANWNVSADHSSLILTCKKANVFPLDKQFKNPCIIAQLEAPRPDEVLDARLFRKKIESLNCNSEASKALDAFFSHANLSDEQSRHHLSAHFLEHFTESDNQIYAIRLLWGMLPIDDGNEVGRSFLLDSLMTHNNIQRLASLTCRHTTDYHGDYGQACKNYHKLQILKAEMSLLSENRCSNLEINVIPLINPYNREISPEDAIRVLSRSDFPRLNYVSISFDKDCRSEDVVQIAKLLPENLKSIGIRKSISPDHFYDFVSNRQNSRSQCRSQYEIYINQWYSFPPYSDLPPTQQECAYNLLLPLAKTGCPFEPPFIELHTDEDLEPTYEALRIVAAIHKPMPLMLEDGVA